MRIYREWLGGSETIDTDTAQGWQDWLDIVQDADEAVSLAARIDEEGEVVINGNEAEFIERYTREDAT